MIVSRSPFALAVLLLAGTAPAQQSSTVPAWADNVDANDSSYFPFLYDATIAQQLWLGSAVAPNVGILSKIKYRRDAGTPQAISALSISNATISLGHTSMSPTTMSTSFANNRTSAMTVVFSGSLNLPAQPPVSGVGPWNVEIVLQSPYAFFTAQGNLLMEYVVPGTAMAKQDYRLDAHRSTGNGVSGTFGQSGSFAGGDVVTYTASGSLLPGGDMTLQADGILQAYPSFAYIGTSTTFWSGLPLPFDLAAFGATGNTLYASMDAIFGLPVVQVGTIRAVATFLLPNDPSLGGKTIYSQSFFIDPPSNALGAVFSNAVQITLGGGAPQTQILAAPDSALPTGGFLFNTGVGGPVTFFEGTIG